MTHLERRASNNIGNDLLMQILNQQTVDSKTLHELKGTVLSRVEVLESAARNNWWMTYVVTPLLFVAHATARQLGVKI
jgi:hypothetical protein